MKKIILLLLIATSLRLVVNAQSADVFVVKSFLAGQKDQVVQSGFRLKGKQGIVTALHGLTGSSMVFGAKNERGEAYGDLTIIEVDIARDVALLSSSTYRTHSTINQGFEKNQQELQAWQNAFIIGHPGGIYERKTICKIGDPTTDRLAHLLVPDASADYFRLRKSPDTGITIVSVQGNFVGGHSGAPLLSMQNKVIAVVNGGILSGIPGISWAIPIADIKWEPINQQILSTIRSLTALQKNSPFIGQLVSEDADALDQDLENEIKFRSQQFKKVLDDLETSIAGAKRDRKLFHDSITGTNINDVIEKSKIITVAFRLGGWTKPCPLASSSDGTGTVWIGTSGYGLRHLPDQSCYRYEKFGREDFSTFQLFSEESNKKHFNTLLETFSDLANTFPPELLKSANRWFEIWNTYDRDRIMKLKYANFNDDIEQINIWFDAIKNSYYDLTNYLTQYVVGNAITKDIVDIQARHLTIEDKNFIDLNLLPREVEIVFPFDDEGQAFANEVTKYLQSKGLLITLTQAAMIFDSNGDSQKFTIINGNGMQSLIIKSTWKNKPPKKVDK